jgi:hypothetical protein
VVVDENLGDVRQERLEAGDVLPAAGVQIPDELEALVAEVDVAVLEDRLQERLADGEELLVDPAADFLGDVGIGLDGPLAGDHRRHGQSPRQGNGRVAAHAAVGLVAGRQPRCQGYRAAERPQTAAANQLRAGPSARQGGRTVGRIGNPSRKREAAQDASEFCNHASSPEM